MRYAPRLLLIAGLAGCGAGTPATDAITQRVERIESGLRPAVAVAGRPNATYPLGERLARYRTPGLSIAIADSGRVVWAGGVGLKEAGGLDSVSQTTLFQAASISKPVAATAMLRLVEDGVFALDEDVNHLLKSWHLPENGFTAKEKVTLRRIASHNAGLTVHGFPGYAQGDSLPTVPQILDGVKPANTGPVRVDTTPGAIWRYAGGGTTIMQLAMIDATGRPFPDLMKELVLTPAGMTLSTYQQPLPPERAGEAATGHKPDGSAVPGHWHVYPEMAAAGLWTTPTDLLHWAFAIAASRAGTEHSLLRQTTAAEMLTVQKAPTGIGPFLAGSGRGFNFGHGGANEGFRSQLIYFPETGQGAAVMANSDNGSLVIQEVLYAIAAEYGWPEYGPRVVTPVAVDSGRLAAVAGEYRTESPPIAVSITLEGGRMFVDAPGVQLREEIVFVDSVKVVGVDSGNEFRIEFDQRGATTALVVGELRLPRVPR